MFDPKCPPKPFGTGHDDFLSGNTIQRLFDHYRQALKLKSYLVYMEYSVKHVHLFMSADDRPTVVVRTLPKPILKKPVWIPNAFGMTGYWRMVARPMTSEYQQFEKAFKELMMDLVKDENDG